MFGILATALGAILIIALLCYAANLIPDSTVRRIVQIAIGIAIIGTLFVGKTWFPWLRG